MDVPGVAVITGAASGIGRACAHAFAVEGASCIALLDLNLDGLSAVKTEVEGLQSRYRDKPCLVTTHIVNVADEKSVTSAFAQIVQDFKRIDYVVNCAGTVMKHPGGAAFCESSDWSRILEINLTGNFFVLKAAAKIMLKQTPILSGIDGRELQRGSIVNFASIQALAGFAASTAYNTSKAGVMGLTRTASEDYAKDGLRINAICPGYVQTPMTMNDPAVLKVMQEKVLTAVPMQRMAQPKEVADRVLYLSGGRSSFVTGTGLVVDGGYLQR